MVIIKIMMMMTITPGTFGVPLKLNEKDDDDNADIDC